MKAQHRESAMHRSEETLGSHQNTFHSWGTESAAIGHGRPDPRSDSRTPLVEVAEGCSADSEQWVVFRCVSRPTTS